MDRGGNFIGSLTTAEGQSVALMLVQQGLAQVYSSAQNAPNYKQLLEAEEKCRNQHIGIWTNYNESLSKNNEEDEETNDPEGKFKNIISIK